MSEKKRKKSPNIWVSKKLPFRARLSELIAGGALLNGEEALLKQLNDEFTTGVNAIRSKKITSAELREHLSVFVWTPQRESLLRKFMGLGSDPEFIYQAFPHLPKEVVDKKKKTLGGHTSLKVGLASVFEAGINRLATRSEIRARMTADVVHPGRDNPFRVSVKDPKKFHVRVLNALHLGTKHDKVFDNNPTRNFLRIAERDGVEAILLTGNLMLLDSKKASGYPTTLRALLSGLEVEIDQLDPDYQKIAKRILDTMPDDEVVYVALRERARSLIFKGIGKIFTNEDGTPVFSGQVPFTFGKEEEELIASAAHYEIGYINAIERNRVKAQREGLQALRKQLLRDSDGATTPQIQKLSDEIEKLIKLEKRMRQTNVAPEFRALYVRVLRALIISWLEEVIPNSKFIAQGSFHCMMGNELVEVAQTENDSTTSGTFDSFMKGANASTLKRSLPSLILLAGGYNDRARSGMVEGSRDGKPATAPVWMLPVFANAGYLKEAWASSIRTVAPIQRLVNDGMFTPGALDVRYVNGVWDTTSLPMNMFALGRVEVKDSKYMYFFGQGDEHIGHPNKRWLHDPVSNNSVPLEVACANIFIRAYIEKGKRVPFHGWRSGGDQHQGQHFENFLHPHSETLQLSQIQKRIRELEGQFENSRGSKKVDAMKEMKSLLERQIQIRGIPWLTHQLEEFYEISLKPIVPLLVDILHRAREANITINGPEDSRRSGVLNLFSGNHVERTTGGHINEGPGIARDLRNLIRLSATGGFTEEELRMLVCAPLHSGQVSVGYGVVSVPDGQKWGVIMRHDPTRKGSQSGWTSSGEADSLHDRGDYAGIFEGLPIVSFNHDIHRFTTDYAPRVTVVSTGSCTESDSYGEKFGMSRANAGMTVVGLPVAGPLSAPIRVINLPHDFIARYTEKPWEIDWDSIFRNPA